jgi:hypothetical protein
LAQAFLRAFIDDDVFTRNVAPIAGVDVDETDPSYRPLPLRKVGTRKIRYRYIGKMPPRQITSVEDGI